MTLFNKKIIITIFFILLALSGYIYELNHSISKKDSIIVLKNKKIVNLESNLTLAVSSNQTCSLVYEKLKEDFKKSQNAFSRYKKEVGDAKNTKVSNVDDLINYSNGL